MSLHDDELLAMFRDEADERIGELVDGLLGFERGEAGLEVLDSCFRQVHSVKGSAGMMGLDEVYALAHAMEDLLADARERGAVPDFLIEPLLHAADALRESVHDRKATGPALEALTRASQAVEPEPGSSPKPDVALAPEPEAGDGQSSSTAAEQPSPAGEPRSMRIGAHKVDRLLDATGETMLHHRRLEYLLAADGGPTPEVTEDELDRGRALLDDLRDAVLSLRTVPLASITGPLPRAVRDVAASHGKDVDLVIVGADTQLDRTVLDSVSDAITHLLRNAVAHGIEAPADREAAGKPARGRVELRASQRGDRVLIRVSDDGMGVAPELLDRAHDPGALMEVLAEAGLSTAGAVTDVSGRGVGLDAVKRSVEAVGGTVEITSEAGSGTAVNLSLPVSVALLEVLLVERAGAVVALPLAHVAEVVAVDGELSLGGRASLEVQGEPLPLSDLVAALGGSAPAPSERAPAVVVTAPEGRAVLVCDRVLGSEEVVVRGLGPVLADAPGYLGATVLGDDRVALLVDAAFLVQAVAGGGTARPAPREEPLPPRVLVVDDQFVVRELQRSILEVTGYRVVTACDGREAADLLARDQDIDLVVTDIEMPEMDGFALLARIREHPTRGSLPVVIVSTRGGEEDERRGLDAGADAYIGKDRFDQAALVETVGRLVGS